MFEKDQQTEATTNQNEEPPEKNVMRLTTTITESTRLSRHERFLDQAVGADCDLIEEAMMMSKAEPINLNKAMHDSNWLATMKEELIEIEKNKTWELVEETIKKPIDLKWVYKMKQRSNGEISKQKETLVARGFLQKPSIDFDEVYASVTRLKTIRIIVSTTT